MNQEVDMEVIVVSSGSYKPNTHGYRNVHSEERLHYPSAINLGVKSSDPDVPFIMLCNDDIIFSHKSLEALLHSRHSGVKGIFNPLSNCDLSHLYFAGIPITKKDGAIQYMSTRFFRYDDAKEYLDQMMKMKSIYPAGLFRAPEFIAFYATLMSREVWNEVGGLDDNFKTGQDDLDFCKRAIKIGIYPFVAINSLIYHFGGVTADQCLTKEDRQYSIDYYKEKHGELPI